MGILIGVFLAVNTVLGIFVKKPVPSTDYQFTTKSTCPFYQDIHGKTQVEPYVICPDKEELALDAAWAKCGEDCIETEEAAK